MTTQNLISAILILVDFTVVCQTPVDISMASMVEWLLCTLTDILHFAERTEAYLYNEAIPRYLKNQKKNH